MIGVKPSRAKPNF